ncbi:endonuclease [Flavobacterium sp.]|uniref:endonuclease n=1 Tax=Flavobacterium sp. TaxID=239 RepID=UPI00286AC9C1|nr:endonuclease [Flavobacterium sp.]
MKRIFFTIALLYTFASYSQVVINEIDADTPSSDTQEFIELKSATPNFSLDGYVLVFYNGTTAGTGVASYLAIDLDSYITDVNGIIHFGNSLVSPTPAIIMTNAVLQNGPDAVALYQANATDFPNNTAATNTALIDAVAYSNSGTVQPTALMTVFGLSTCVNENANSNAATESIQRKTDGTYEVKAPTAGMNNDGSGIPLTYLSLTTSTTTVTEGETFNITFTSTQPITGTNLVINFTLTNGSFHTNDYTGTTSVTIPVGAVTGTRTIQIVNDGTNEGDEELEISASGIPVNYSLYNNNVIVRVNDINFAVLPFGTPANPTYGNIASTAPAGYYNTLEGLSGAALKQAIQDIIANPSAVHAHSYGDIINILKTADQNPQNSNQVWLIYTEQPRSKIDYQTGSSIIGKWNREHIYCQSRGNYGDLYNTNPDGINVWSSTGPDDIGAGLSDAHHLRAVDGQENSSRNNRNYGVDYNGPAAGTSTWKGDVSRALFYMAVRYNGLNVVNGNPTDGTIGQIGDLATLLTWNHTDPRDDFEMNRNNYIYTWQVNRNPFIDYPLLADYIWGAHAGEQWHFALSTQQFSENQVVLYPNPAKDYVLISGLNKGTVEIYSMSGAKLYDADFNNDTRIPLDLASGIYMMKITSDNNATIKKLIVK